MVECSLCSIISFLFVSVYNIVLYALEYPIVILCLLLFVSLFCITNLNSGKFLCELSRSTIPLTGGGHHDEHHDRFGIGKPMANGRCCDYANGSGMINKNFFNYDMDNGPHTWKHSGNNQSPINIIEERVQRFPIRELLTWNHYEDLPTSIQLENNGKTVIVRASYSGNVPTVCGADLLVSYTFVQLCFRWSSVGNDGSEHMLNHRKFPLELQAMHRTGPQTGDCTSSYDLLMIAYFFQISSNNPYLEPIVQNLHRIQQPYTKVEIDPFPLSYLCQQFRSGFYSYGGSLTEPPCYQGAEWFITPEPLAISEAQLNEFRKLFSGDGKTRILRNSRPVQQMDSQRGVNLNWYNPVENINHMPPTDSAVQCGDDAEAYEQ